MHRARTLSAVAGLEGHARDAPRGGGAGDRIGLILTIWYMNLSPLTTPLLIYIISNTLNDPPGDTSLS